MNKSNNLQLYFQMIFVKEHQLKTKFPTLPMQDEHIFLFASSDIQMRNELS